MQQICHINFFIPEIILIIFELFDWEFSTVLFSMFFLFLCIFFVSLVSHAHVVPCHRSAARSGETHSSARTGGADSEGVNGR